MNKAELIKEMTRRTKFTKAEASLAIDTLFSVQNGIIVEELKKGNEVKLQGFGIFKRLREKARLRRNPRAGESIQIPASNQPKFKAGKGLKAAVN